MYRCRVPIGACGKGTSKFYSKCLRDQEVCLVAPISCSSQAGANKVMHQTDISFPSAITNALSSGVLPAPYA